MAFDGKQAHLPGDRGAVLQMSSARHRTTLSLVGNYPPRQCGIATFTADVVRTLSEYQPDITPEVWSLEDAPDVPVDGVTGTITRQDPASYAAAARALNASPTDVVWLQHEFGIFGGPDGEMVCDFVDQIAAPLLVTFHTVLEHPSDNQRRIMDHLVSRASRVMVMSHASRERLIASHGAPAELVQVIEHGAPDRPFGREAEFKAARGLGDRPVLTTFGLLGPGKGLENVIDALPRIRAANPDALYRIVGATHPNLVAQHGESYRDGLKAQAERLGVADMIEWDDRFVDTPELLDQLEACDIYLTPYPGMQQSTSGTLSYAVALGKAVVSTPYVHARELLADGVGRLVPPNDPGAIATAVCDLLSDSTALTAQKRRAWQRGRVTIWPRFAEAVAHMVRNTAARCISRGAVRPPSFTAVARMSDSTGMYQHAIGVVPDRNHGYCLDDNVRALMLANVAVLPEKERTGYALTCAAFIQHAWNADAGGFRNFMRFDRSWCEDLGSEDSNGRTLWALGRTMHDNSDPDLRDWAEKLFDQALPACERIDSPRALAFITLGAVASLEARPGHEPSLAAVRRGAAVLANLLEASRRPDWFWFEAVLAYDNPRMSQALIEAGRICGNAQWTELGLETLRWICERQTGPGGRFRPIGSEGFGLRHEQRPFDQQPLEAQAMLDACAAAARVDNGAQWSRYGLSAWNWFFGANDRGVVLADPATGLCRDGINPRGANLNCGAESILAFQLGYHSMLALLPDTTQESGIALEPSIIERQPIANP